MGMNRLLHPRQDYVKLVISVCKRKKPMKKTIIALLACLLLTGCGRQEDSPKTPAVPTAVTEPAATVPENGNPDDVTCLGSYTWAVDDTAVVARIGEKELSNGELSAFYWAEAAAWKQSGHVSQPDFSVPLDTQPCPVDETARTWQQFFLKRALNTWHGAQALMLRAETEILPTEPAYQPDLALHEELLTGKPATKFLYGYNKHYAHNTKHQAFLDNIPQMLETLAGERGFGSAEGMAKEAFGVTLEDLTAFVDLYNQGYMYFTFLSYDLVPGEEAAAALGALEAETEGFVNIRHIQLDSEAEAEQFLTSWQKNKAPKETTFGELAVKQSKDPGSASSGGAYYHLRQGQLEDKLDSWCFDPERQPGDVAAIGNHVLYFVGSGKMAQARAEQTLVGHMALEYGAIAKKQYPMEVEYSAISLSQGTPAVSLSDVLYPDIAHERFPEIPLYIQNDYGNTRYGGQLLSSHGCGITCLAMLGTYMTDTVMTPPELAAQFGRYCLPSGTDATMFIRESSGLGFYFKEKINDYRKAAETLKAGYPIITVQLKGMWTRGGHYILLESMTDEDHVQVRDSSLKNYGKLEGHEIDSFTWKNIITSGMGCWAFEKRW